MTTPIKTIGLAMAVSAAGLFAATGVAAAGEEAKVHCYGVNACKGHGSCKGKGFLIMTAEKCAEAGGTVEEEDK